MYVPCSSVQTAVRVPYLVPRRSVRIRPSNLNLLIHLPRRNRGTRCGHTPLDVNSLPGATRASVLALLTLCPDTNVQPQFLMHICICTPIVGRPCRSSFRVDCGHAPGGLLRRHSGHRHRR